MRTAFAAAVALVCQGWPSIRAEEGLASVYVVDKSADYAETDGACLPYTGTEVPGPRREILALAKAPPGATLFLFAVQNDAPYLGLAPVIAPQSEDTLPARFPGAEQTWPHEQPATPVDLYIAVFDSSDPDLAKLSEYQEWLAEALAKKDEVEALLHTEAILKRLANVLRQRRVEDYRVKYEDGLSSNRVQPSAKAAITRGTPETGDATAARFPKAPLAAVRRGLKTLDTEWRQDGRRIPYGPGQPGVLVFTITASAPPRLAP